MLRSTMLPTPLSSYSSHHGKNFMEREKSRPISIDEVSTIIKDAYKTISYLEEDTQHQKDN